jgi:uncharacterized membrane protein
MADNNSTKSAPDPRIAQLISAISTLSQPMEALASRVREIEHQSKSLAPEQPEPLNQIPIPKHRLETFIDGVFAVALTVLVVVLAEPKEIPNVVKGWEWWTELWPRLLVFVYSFAVVGIYWIANHNELNMLVELGGPPVRTDEQRRRIDARNEERVRTRKKARDDATRMRPFLHVNLLFLLFIVFIPFSAAVLGNNFWLPLEIATNKRDYGVLGWIICSSHIVIAWPHHCSMALVPGTQEDWLFWRARVPFLVYAMNLVLTSATLQWSWSYIHSGDAGRFNEKHRRAVPNTTRRNWLILGGAVALIFIGILIPVFYVQFALVAVPLGYSALRLGQGQKTATLKEVAILAGLAIIGILIGIFFS